MLAAPSSREMVIVNGARERQPIGMTGLWALSRCPRIVVDR